MFLIKASLNMTILSLSYAITEKAMAINQFILHGYLALRVQNFAIPPTKWLLFPTTSKYCYHF